MKDAPRRFSTVESGQQQYEQEDSPPVLLTSNIVTFLTKFSGGGGVKLLQGYMLRASQGGDDFSSFGGYVIASAAG